MVYKVGLTGGAASGKTTVTDLFRQLGVEIIDADVIARRLLDKETDCYKQVVGYFGPQVLTEDDEINRAWLREHIFSHATAKTALEAILHPQVRQQMLAEAAQCHGPYCILSVPLLAEAQMQDLVNRIVVIDLDIRSQLSRLITRDNINEQQARQMLNNQMHREQRLQIADDIIDNSGPPEALKSQVDALHKQYLKLAENA